MKNPFDLNDFKKFDYLPFAYINLSAIKSNAKLIKCNTSALFCAVVKSNAYGHGLVESAWAINSYCDYFAVAELSEGVTLRISGIDKPIICLTPISDITRAIEYDITICVHNLNYFNNLNSFCLKNNLSIKVHIAVNTGMNRLGLDSINELDYCLKNAKIIKITGIYSHFYNSSSKRDAQNQFLRFLPFAQKAKGYNGQIVAHISASGGFVLDEKYHLDMVRIGLMLYGYSPIKSCFKLNKAMTVYAPLLQKRSLLRGQNLLYGSYKLNKDLQVGIYAYGYANGERKPIDNQINNSCMNICAIKSQRRFVTIMKNATTLARRFNTIEYQILTSFGNNCKRIYGEIDENYFGKI
ncbi:MAG: alanine racemase [Clostridia bacterium]|nr:alanine racemase [Clostridia bacterium]